MPAELASVGERSSKVMTDTLDRQDNPNSPERVFRQTPGFAWIIVAIAVVTSVVLMSTHGCVVLFASESSRAQNEVRLGVLLGVPFSDVVSKYGDPRLSIPNGNETTHIFDLNEQSRVERVTGVRLPRFSFINQLHIVEENGVVQSAEHVAD